MSKWQEVAQWMYGDVNTSKGFWYSHQLRDIEGLTDEQLFWVPDPKSLCILWHVGHIAHRERIHIGRFLQGLKKELMLPQYKVFGTEWRSVEDLRKSISTAQDIFEWVRDVRKKSHDYITSLTDDDFHKIPPSSEENFSIAHWLFITVAHTALHIGKIQLLRSLIEGKKDRPC